MITSLAHDVLILGGGPAGSTLAIALAEAGRQVILVEKTKEPQHKICGEFLSPESLPLLRQRGIAPEQFGAQTIHSVRIAGRDVLSESALPVPALSLSRRVLDEALLQRAQRAGAGILRGYTAEHLLRAAGAGKSGVWRVQIHGSGAELISLQGTDVFLATGKHDLRNWARASDHPQRNLVALKMYYELTPREASELQGYVEILLFGGGYAGFQRVENGWANLCVLITREKLLLLGGNWANVVEYIRRCVPHLARRLSGAVPALDRPLAVSSIPYGYCAAEPPNNLSP